MVKAKETAMQQCQVELYSFSTCSHCRDTKDLLKQCGINYDCVDVDQLEPEKRRTILAEIKKMNPQCTFPTLVAGEKVIVGFKEAEIKEALGIS
jgi:glutaredoxin-like protein NrdH